MESGKICELDIERNVGRIATAKGDFLHFDSDNVIVGQWHDLKAGQLVWFTRETVHGPQPMPLQVRTVEPAAIAPGFNRLELTAETLGLEQS